MFGKFKYILKIFKGKVFKFFFAFFADVFGGILFKVKNIGIICAFAILLPCLIYASPVGSGEMVSKDLKGFQVAVDIPGKQKLIEGGISSFTFGKNGVMLCFRKVISQRKAPRKVVAASLDRCFSLSFRGITLAKKAVIKVGRMTKPRILYIIFPQSCVAFGCF